MNIEQIETGLRDFLSNHSHLYQNYHLHKSNDGYRHLFSLKKNTLSHDYTISMVFSGYSYFNEYKLDGSLSVYLGIKEVEEIYMSLLYEILYNKHYLGEHTSTIQSNLLPDDSNARNFFLDSIIERDNWGQFQILIENLIVEKAFPFFNRYENLLDVYKTIESLPIDKLANFIPGATPMKRLIIKRLCNDPDFDAYAQRYLDFLKRKAMEDPANYAQDNLVAPELYKILKDTPPRYNL